jgi:hypothetical protein
MPVCNAPPTIAQVVSLSPKQLTVGQRGTSKFDRCAAAHHRATGRCVELIL